MRRHFSYLSKQVLAAGLLAASFACAAMPASASASAADRITQAISGPSNVALRGSVPPLARQAEDLGPAPGGTVLPWMTISFQMSAAQQASLSQLLLQQQETGSPLYHRWLTPEQFAAQFGASAHDMAAVAAWLAGQGFKINAESRGGQWIAFAGTAAQAEQAFGMQIHTLRLNGEVHIANVTEPMVPAGLAQLAASVQGMDDFRLKPRSVVRRVPSPQFTSSVSGNHFIAPGDFYTIYDVNPLISAGTTGSGITIAVMGQTDISNSNVAAFRTASGLSTTNLPATRLYGTDPGVSQSDIDEAQLDVEWSGAVAPDASILYVNSNAVFTSLMNAIDNNLAPILSISYGNCEAAIGQATLSQFNLLFEQANAQGQTIVAPAGDSGATDCDGGTDSAGNPITTATQGLAVDFPASSPYVTGAGGTTFAEGSGNYWSTTDGANSGSALSYIPETTWNDTNLYQVPAAGSGGGYGYGGYGYGGGTTSTVPNGLSAGGGGASLNFAKPTWQSGQGVPNDFARDVPDVSLAASPNHDGYLFCTENYSGTSPTGPSCNNGYRLGGSNPQTSNSLSVVGGTSVSTPTFAGILALVVQKTGGPLGNANPVIYALANSNNYGNVFHDVTSGTNDSPCAQGSVGCPNGGTIGYSATVGYDLTTGWGSVNAFNLANLWSTASVTGLGTQLVSSTSISVSPTSSTQGTAVTLTATVAAQASGGATPTGTVQFLIDGAAIGGAATLTNGTATYTTSSIGAGDHTATAVYQGDSVYATSEASASLTVTSATNPDFTISPLSGTLTVSAPGQSTAAFPLTFTSVNGFNGTVTISIASSASAINPNFSSNAVYSTSTGTWALTLPANGSVSTSLTIGTVVGGLLQKEPSGSAAMRKTGGPFGLAAAGGAAALAGMMLLWLPRRRRWTPALLGMALLAALSFGIAGCSNGGGTIAPPTGTQTGTYTLTVTGTASSGSSTVTHSSNLTLVVN